MRFISKGLWGLFLGLATFGILALAAVQFSKGRSDEGSSGGFPGRGGGGPQAITVSVQKIEPGTESPVIATFGEVTASRELQLRSPEGGEIVFLDPNFKNGALVSEGDLLAQIDPSAFQAALDLAASDLASAKADVDDAKRSVSLAEQELAASVEQLELRQAAYDRQVSLSERGVGTDAALESAELSLSSAQQSVLSKEQALASAKTSLVRAEASVTRNQITVDENTRKLENTSIFAPFSGALANVSVIEGVIVSSNERIGTLIDQSALEVSVLLTLAQFSDVIARVGSVQGLSMEVSLTDDSEVFEAQVLRSDATISEGQTGRRIYASLSPEASEQIRPGDFVRIKLIEPEMRGVTWLPALAVSSDDTGLLLGEGNVLQETDLTVISRDGDQVLISARGLEDRYLVKEITPQIGRGMTVNPVEDGQPLEPEKIVELSPEQQAEWLEAIENNDRMPEPVKAQILKQIEEGKMPESTYERLSQRIGGRG